MLTLAQNNPGAVSGDWANWVALLLVAVAFGAAALSGVRASRRPSYAPTSFRTIPVPVALADTTSRGARRLQRFETAMLLVLGGYLFFDRAFAWLHIPGTPLFVGELVIVFGAFAVVAARTNIVSVWRGSSSFKTLLVYMGWGAFLLAISDKSYGQDAIRDAALWYYGVIAIFIVVLALSLPDRIGNWLRLFGRAIPFFLIWFPVAIVVDAVASDAVPLVPDSFIPVTSHSVGNMAVMAAVALGFLWLVDSESKLFTPRQRVALTSLATVVILFAGMKNRGGFLAAATALMVAMLLMRRRRGEMSLVMVGAVVLLLSVGLLGNIKIGLFEDQRDVSVEQLLLNLSSIIDSDSGGSRQETTIEWRLQLWGNVIEDVASDFPLTGYGPGPDLGKIYNVTTNENVPLRNPHNSHVGVLARSGLVGATLWIMMWLSWSIELLLLRTRLIARGRTVEAGVAAWLLLCAAAILVNAFFDPTLEGPQVAWWSWGFVGLGVAMIVLDRVGRLPDLRLTDEGAGEMYTETGLVGANSG